MNYLGFTTPVWTWLHSDEVDVKAFGHPGFIARRSGSQAMATARSVMAQVPYSVTLTNMILLGSHDSARWAHAAGSAEVNAVGVAVLCGWPGSPSIFYGDEIGLGARSTEERSTRQPFPWHAPDEWDRDLLSVYRTLVGLRRRSSALAVGGMRFVSIGDDHLAWIREALDEQILVYVARAGHDPVEIDLNRVGYAEAESIIGAPLTSDAGRLTLHSAGPTWAFLRLS